MMTGVFPVESARNVQNENVSSRKIVVFEDWLTDETAQDALLSEVGGHKIKKLSLVNGQAAHLNLNTEKALAKKSGIKRIDDDILNYAIGRPVAPAPQPSPEVAGWGYTRIGAANTGAVKGAEVKVGIIDTGIDLNHPDLTVVGGFNAISPLRTAEDDNGHGTHVAGIVAALDNEIGVIGVAPKAKLYAIKVLNKKGVGYLSDIIEGLQWAIDNDMDVVNMSLGGASDVLSYHEAIIKAYESGIVIAAAAGNDGPLGAVGYPAKYPETIAVSAINNSDVLASFSTYGPEVDLAAPGQYIYSTYKGDTYATLSGTSMATPFVSGVAALVFSAPLVSENDLNNNGIWDPSEVKQKIFDSVELLPGLTNDQQGYGLVKADEATR
jgi:subtilisin family serine protease